MIQSATLGHNKLCFSPASSPVNTSAGQNRYIFKTGRLQIVFHLADPHIHAQWCNTTTVDPLSVSLPRSWLKCVVLVLGLIAFRGTPLCDWAAHLGASRTKSNCNSVDLFRDPWAFETYLSHLVESYKHIGVGKFFLLFSLFQGIEMCIFCRGMWFPSPNWD